MVGVAMADYLGLTNISYLDSTAVGGSSTFVGPVGVIPAGTWTFGSLLMSVSGAGTVQVFPTNAANGLGSPTPPPSLTLPATTLAGLGFASFSQTNPTLTFIVADNNYPDNGKQFLLSQAVGAVPTLDEWGLIGLTALLTVLGLMILRRRRA